MYKVLKTFSDLHDCMTIYKAGDTYPREGYNPTEERISELSSCDNAFGEPIIEKAKSKGKKGV